MDEDKTFALGDYCEALLRDDYFNDLHGEFVSDGIKQVFMTDAGAAEAREHIYKTVKALDAFVGLMRAKVAARDEIIKSREAAPVIDVDDDPFDTEQHERD